MGNKLAKFKSNIYRLRHFRIRFFVMLSIALVTVFLYSIGTVHKVAADNTALLSAEVHDASLSVSIPDNNVTLDLDATASNLATGDLSVFVTTNGQNGYTLMMSADSSDLTRTESVNGSYPTISTLALDSTAEKFGVNQWGYKLSSDDKYHPFDNLGTQVGYKETAATDDENIITFASRVNSNTVAGTYNLTLLFNATVNPKPLTIDDLKYMQDFTTISSDDRSSVLASMVVGTSYTLIDSRDDQNYSIAKLADGKIWMTRNLAIGCAGSGNSYSDSYAIKTLTSVDSNVSSSYNTSATNLATGDSFSLPYQTCSSAYGAWYNINAVSAGTISNDPDPLASVVYDICPKGWRLPDYSEAQTLVNVIGSTPVTFNPGAVSGYWAGNAYQTGYTFWWTSTLASASTGSHRVIVYRGTNLTYDWQWSSRGFNARCILK